jgi:hypothetical protein
MKKLKSTFCQTFNDYKGTAIHHIDEIHLATFEGRELFNFADLYASRVEDAYMKRRQRKAFVRGLFIGMVVCVIIYFVK